MYKKKFLRKKSLGQHFLKNRYYLGLVADAADIQKGDLVVEVGPGEGTLTAVLLERGARVIAVEKDRRLIPILKEKFTGKDFEVFEGDVLKDGPWGAELKDRPWKLLGNIPYYITGALLKKFLSGDIQPSTLVFLIQKEVAERIARSKKESILSLSIKAYGEPKYIKTVSRGAFSPPPKVDSAILAVSNISRNNFTNTAHEQKFFELVKKGFSSKRKLLLNNLGKGYASVLQKTAIAHNARAEDVPLEQWLILSKCSQAGISPVRSLHL